MEHKTARESTVCVLHFRATSELLKSFPFLYLNPVYDPPRSNNRHTIAPQFPSPHTQLFASVDVTKETDTHRAVSLPGRNPVFLLRAINKDSMC